MTEKTEERIVIFRGFDEGNDLPDSPIGYSYVYGYGEGQPPLPLRDRDAKPSASEIGKTLERI